MEKQVALFGETEPTANEALSGFRYRKEFLSFKEERDLAIELSALDLRPFEFQGHLGNRRVTSFGLKYDFGRRTVDPAPAFPRFIQELVPRVAAFANVASEQFQQVGVNEYRPGAGIGWHKDKPEFGIIAGISLLSPATMRFRRSTKGGWDRVSFDLEPRSIYILSGEARLLWEHSVPAQESLRYSITFRTLSERFLAKTPRANVI
ncbi:alpha-ketoglutarate-dependent dioxygenase AlkB [Terriglobus roseus]|uniref:Alkylated DNA repair dioxygenase AlkB n=1 Tax=Terriglobus roseus TaxID=392734 RepID=A0A1G7GLG8_9BACT|nr:alpha-ketoglutarate-dependent dioxygenase AlkB [Terriglobus roseus]SDE88987.1 Alkylated DNA repair dioxygenase AlkB [Terriglobus roseus]